MGDGGQDGAEGLHPHGDVQEVGGEEEVVVVAQEGHGHVPGEVEEGLGGGTHDTTHHKGGDHPAAWHPHRQGSNTPSTLGLSSPWYPHPWGGPGSHHPRTLLTLGPPAVGGSHLHPHETPPALWGPDSHHPGTLIALGPPSLGELLTPITLGTLIPGGAPDPHHPESPPSPRAPHPDLPRPPPLTLSVKMTPNFQIWYLMSMDVILQEGGGVCA